MCKMVTRLFICIAYGTFCVTFGYGVVYRDTISMPIQNITEADTYLCLATPVEVLRGNSLIGYELDSMEHVAHHVSVAIAESYNSQKPFWSCRAQQGHIVKGRVISLGGKEGAEVQHAEMVFQEDIGLQLGEEAKLNYIILQVHYANPSTAEHLHQATVNLTLLTTPDRRPFAMQKLLLVSTGFIPPQTIFSSEIAARWTGGSVTIVSYTLHTHDYGVSEEGYLIRNGHAILIGRKKITVHGTSRFELETPLEMKYGDIIAARCIYNNTETYPVKFGNTRKDEMCNFGVNYKYPTGDQSYPQANSYHQNAQYSTWCSDTVTGTRVLCEDMETLKYNM